MKKILGLVLYTSFLVGCAQDPAYLQSVTEAEKILRSKKAVEFYKEYYEYPQHKAFAQSKDGKQRAYASYKTSEAYAVEDALKLCNERLIKRFSKLTDKIYCEVININNEWLESEDYISEPVNVD